MHLVLWQPIPSFHQEGFLAALAQADWVDSVTLKYEEELPESRRRSGWRDLALPRLVLERIQPLEIPENSEEYVHIFSGFQTHRQIWEAFNRLPPQALCRRFAFAEAPECIGWQGLLRKIKYKVVSWQIAPRLDGVLALGQLGVDFYRSLLPASVPVHEFAYYDVNDRDIHDCPHSERQATYYRFLYVGQLIPRKGVDRLLQAFANVSSCTWKLDIVGEGTQMEALQKQAVRLGIDDQLQWHGRMPSSDLGRFFQNADCLVLPSRWDGWGMTVNEALRYGCDVLASMTCGVASILTSSQRLSLQEVNWCSSLEEKINSGSMTMDDRLKNQTIARSLTGEVGAIRLKEILGK
jgi:glycosyltransferase involved in cell wall biosynthesis